MGSAFFKFYPLIGWARLLQALQLAFCSSSLLCLNCRMLILQPVALKLCSVAQSWIDVSSFLSSLISEIILVFCSPVLLCFDCRNSAALCSSKTLLCYTAWLSFVLIGCIFSFHFANCQDYFSILQPCFALLWLLRNSFYSPVAPKLGSALQPCSLVFVWCVYRFLLSLTAKIILAFCSSALHKLHWCSFYSPATQQLCSALQPCSVLSSFDVSIVFFCR